ncbi:hypothetical protein C8R45DRAFT_1115549 [Mycena sanguinolenta]|nr:hypothetical protein C8R45DRAFT_1115549 [Mycena sanguinolenta]
MISPVEVLRLLGPDFQPHPDLNCRHFAILRKAVELNELDIEGNSIEWELGRTTNLRVNMGTGTLFNFVSLGQVYIRTGITCRLLDAEAREILRGYLVKYDTYFKCHGDQFVIRDPNARDALQQAEQTWHDWILRYLRVKRKVFIDLTGEDDEPVVTAPPTKKLKFLGTVDLTVD